MYQVNAIYYQLQAKGVVFPDINAQNEVNKVKKAAETRNPDAVANQQEADDIAKAIAESLKTEENEKTNKQQEISANTTETPNLYNLEELSRGEPVLKENSVQKSPPAMRQARALYDFEADEENEVTFKAGHMIILLDTSHEAWWRGRSTISGLEGLFPANFVEEIQQTNNNVAQANSNEREQFENQSENNEDNNKNSDKNIIVPLDLDRVEQTLANLRVHDPALEEPDMLKFNEKLCEQMIPLITEKVHTLDEKYTEVNSINDKFQSILAAFGNFQQHQMPYQNMPQNMQQQQQQAQIPLQNYGAPLQQQQQQMNPQQFPSAFQNPSVYQQPQQMYQYPPPSSSSSQQFPPPQQ